MEARLFDPADLPPWTTAAWYAERERAPHLEQGIHQGRLHLARDFIVQAWEPHGAVVDLGAGDGGLLQLLYADGAVPGAQAWGYDLQQTNLLGAIERGVQVQYLDVVAHPELVNWAPIAVATEMIEHLVDPHAFVRSVRSEVLVASSPVNETAESYYAFHLWAWDMEGYAALLEQGGFTVDRHEQVDGFQVIRGRRQ